VAEVGKRQDLRRYHHQTSGVSFLYHFAVVHHINKRWMLVALVVGGQVLALAVGSVWLVNWLKVSLSDIVRQRVTASTTQYAAQIGLMIDDMGITDLGAGPGNPGWERLQGLVERIRLPYDGFLCLIDGRDGRVICHPDLRSDPSIGQSHLGELTIAGPIAGLTIGRAGGGTNPDAGLVVMPDEVRLVAVRNLPGMNAKLLVQQREKAVLETVDQFVGKVKTIALTLIIIVVVFSTTLTAAIVRQYENRLASINENLEAQVRTRSEGLLKSRSAVIFGLAKLAESRDDQTGQHLERIRHYVLILADELSKTRHEIDRAMVETLGETSSLHDIGKVGIPDSVLLSPEKLSPEQRAIIQKHPLIGGDTLLAIRKVWGDDSFLVTACEIAFAHHEKWDGSGYPFGLVGENIPLAARIVAVADVYDALTSQRVYKKAMSHEEARQVILAGAGTHFDPGVIEAFRLRENDFRHGASTNGQAA
jgi:response regulator RpfG family c-di-GMP phosphodiesterase